MRIARVESILPGEVCRIYSYTHWWMKEESRVEPEEYLVRTSTPGRWKSVTDKYKQFEFLRGNTGELVILDGGIRVMVE